MKNLRLYTWSTLVIILLAITIGLMIRFKDDMVYVAWVLGGIFLIATILTIWFIVEKLLHHRATRVDIHGRLRLDKDAQSLEKDRLALDRQQADAELLRAKGEYLKAQAEAAAMHMSIEQYRKAMDAGLHYPGPHGYPVHVSMEPTTGQAQIQPTDYRVFRQIAGPTVSDIANREDPKVEVTEVRFPQPVRFDDVLRTFQPTSQKIYLLNTVNGPITDAMNKVCHVGLAAPTGGGKTNTTRLLTAQFAYVGAKVYLASPNFAQVKLNKDHLEDWRPIVQHLAAPPAQTDEQISALLDGFLELFEKRKAQEQRSPRRGVDVYLILGEWPGIVARLKDASKVLELLLRESRQYGIHIVTEFQDALVATLGVSSGVRENLLHCYYFGGDLNTAKVMLNLKKGERVSEVGLGSMGAAYMRAHEKELVAGRVPHFTNGSLYTLLGEPPDPMTDDVIMDESQIPATYWHVDEHGKYVEGSILEVDEPVGMEALAPNPLHRPGGNAVAQAPRSVIDLPAEYQRRQQKIPSLEEVVAAFPDGLPSVTDIKEGFKITHHQAYKLYNQLRAAAGMQVEEG